MNSLHGAGQEPAPVVAHVKLDSFTNFERVQYRLHCGAIDGSAKECERGLVSPRIAGRAFESSLRQNRLAFFGCRNVASEMEGSGRLFGAGQNTNADVGGACVECRNADAFEFRIVVKCGVPGNRRVGGSKFHIVGDFRDRRFEHAVLANVGFQLVPLACRLEQFASHLADGCLVRVAQSRDDVFVEQIINTRDAFRVALLDHDDWPLSRDRNRFANQALLDCLIDVAVVGRDVDVTGVRLAS